MARLLSKRDSVRGRAQKVFVLQGTEWHERYLQRLLFFRHLALVSPGVAAGHGFIPGLFLSFAWTGREYWESFLCVGEMGFSFCCGTVQNLYSYTVLLLQMNY
jgi:hypothetical protein